MHSYDASHRQDDDILMCVYVCVCGMFAGETSNFENAFDLSKINLSGMPLAFYSGMYAYAGW